MAVLTGTSGADTLIGTPDDDVLMSLGGIDYLSGGAGADEYQIYQSTGSHHLTIEDLGSDGAVDTITGGRGLYASASLGYSAWATAERIGDDLVIVLPGKPYRYHSPGYGSVTVEIVDHFSGEAVETMVLGGISYLLATTQTLITADNVIMAGTRFHDALTTGDGNDFLTGNRGRDTLASGAGDDTIFGGTGRDVIDSGTGNDRVFGGGTRDIISTGDGADWVYGEQGNDVIRAGAGNDFVYGQDGNDRLFGDAGADTITGGDGDDRMYGGADGDTYRLGYDVDNLAATGSWGHDVIRDVGDRNPAYNNLDAIELFGLYGPSSGNSSEAFARLSFERVGSDMLISADDGASTVLVQNQFAANSRFVIEQLVFNAGYWSPLVFNIIDAEHHDIGDDRGSPNGIVGERNEVIFGSDGDDMVFGDSGTNFIWLGAGADTLIYKESDATNLFGYGGGAVNDIVMDFDPTEDRLDFTEIDGLTLGDLVFGEDAEGDATIYWASGDIEISSIHIELRGVALSEISGLDIFDFA